MGRIKNQYTIPGPQRVRHQEYQIEKDTKTITTRYSERRRRMKKEKVVIEFDDIKKANLVREIKI